MFLHSLVLKKLSHLHINVKLSFIYKGFPALHNTYFRTDPGIDKTILQSDF